MTNDTNLQLISSIFYGFGVTFGKIKINNKIKSKPFMINPFFLNQTELQ
jgi:hypothetical protein